MKESTAKRANNCKLFVMANCEAEYQDAFGETRGYSPRDGKRNKRNDGEQLVFWR